MYIRKLNENDASYMYEWMHDIDIVKDLNKDFSLKTLDDCKKFIEIESSDDCHFAISDDNDEYMGTVSLKNINTSAEFAIVLRQKALGKSYGIFAMKWILSYGFEKLRLNNIYWCVSINNIRAQKFYNKNSFQICNFSTICDYIISDISYSQDLIWYNINKEEWVKRSI